MEANKISLPTNRAVGYPEILLSFACFLLIVFLGRRGRRCSRSPRNWPVVGMLPGFMTQLQHCHDWGTDVLRESGCTFRFKGPWFTTSMDILATADPANVNHVFNANFANYPKGTDFLQIFDVFGGGIFNADADSWKTQRRAAHTLLADPRFRRFVARTARAKVEGALLPLLTRAAETAGSALDLQDVFLRFTFDTTCTLVLGVDLGSLSPGLPIVPFAKAMDDVEEVLFFRHIVPMSWWKLLRWLRVGEEKKMALAWETIDHFIANHISRKEVEVRSKGRRNILQEEGGGEVQGAADDLLTSYLVRGRELGEDGILDTQKYLRDTTLNLMLAGRDATAATLTWFCFVVSQHPLIEQKILDELTAILILQLKKPAGCHPREKPILFDAEELISAVYLEAALHETLRLYPTIPFEHKAAVRPDLLPSGDRVDRKTKLLFSLYSMGRMEGIWGKDCCEFRPERWISERGKLKHEPSYKFFSFSSGPRSCLGKDMAFTQMKAVAAAMIYNFHVDVDPAHRVAPKLSIILHMENGLKVRVNRRRAAAAMIG
uniref:Cytochrome P450 86B1 n=1 Tax=Anthurium amnicola TaxID=1678845 RepID=A0A1D1Y222_9ARAE